MEQAKSQFASFKRVGSFLNNTTNLTVIAMFAVIAYVLFSRVYQPETQIDAMIEQASSQAEKVGLDSFLKCTMRFAPDRDRCEVDAVALVVSRGLSQSEASRAIQAVRQLENR